MKRRPFFLLGLVLLILVGVALALPGSPAYLPNLLRPPALYHDHTLSYWLEAAHSDDLNDRRDAARAMGQIGTQSDAAVTELTKVLLGDADRGARIEASLALTKMDPASPTLVGAVPSLARALEEDKEPVVRLNCAIALFRLGGEAKPAVPALLRAVQDSRNDTNGKIFYFTVQEMAAVALGQASAGTAEAVPALTQKLAGARTAASRVYYVRALGAVGPQARPCLAAIRSLLQDESPHLRQAAEKAIERIDPK
jgi:HEAT repeat protein